MGRNRIRVCLLLASVSFVLRSSTAIAAVIDYWRFEEGSGTTIFDETGLANGTGGGWSANVPTSVIPQTGQSDVYSLHFGVVSITPIGNIDLGSNFTFECFLNLDTIPVQSTEYPFFSFIENADTWIKFVVSPAGNQIYFEGSQTGPGGSGVYGSQQLSLSIGTWYHFAFVKNGAIFQSFLNGNSIGSGTLNVGQDGAYNFGTNGDYFIGYDSVTGRGFDGFMDEIRISNTSLDPSQFLNAVPEPSTFALVAATLALLVPVVRKRTRWTRLKKSGGRQ